MKQESLKAIDLEVLKALFKQAYLTKTADKISKDLNIDYCYTLKIFNKDLYAYLEALKGYKTKKKDRQ